MINHSPLPWNVRHRDVHLPVHEFCEIVDSNFKTILSNETYYPAPVSNEDQRFIVQACNCHHDLLGACKDVVKRYQDFVNKPNFVSFTPECVDMLNKLEAVIHKAESFI